MNKWADYVITYVSYIPTGDRITTLGVRQDLGDKLSDAETWTREAVIRQLGYGHTFVTATVMARGGWSKGARVRVFVREGEAFLRTDAHQIAQDSLGELPTCSSD